MATFTPDEIYPPTGVSMKEYLTTYVDAVGVTTMTRAEQDALPIVHGHYPYATYERLGADRVSITILRDPVDRVESLLRMNTRTRPADRRKSLEEIYEDPALFEMQIKDHQAKVFAIVAADESDSALHGIDVDAERLAVAKANLESIDELGFQDNLGALMQHMTNRYGWSDPPAGQRLNTNDQVTVRASDSLRRRIADDNPADQEFWEFACALRSRREAPRP